MSLPHHNLYFVFFSNALSYFNAFASSYLMAVQSTSIFLNSPLSSRCKFTCATRSPLGFLQVSQIQHAQNQKHSSSCNPYHGIITQRANPGAVSLTPHIPSLTLPCQFYFLWISQIFPIISIPLQLLQFMHHQPLPEIWWPPPHCFCDTLPFSNKPSIEPPVFLKCKVAVL